MLSILFGPKREKMAGYCRKLCDEGPSMIRMIRCWNVRYMGHVARMGEKRETYGKLIHRAPQTILWNPDFTGIQNCKLAAISFM
jgi:hypothetical protein